MRKHLLFKKLIAFTLGVSLIFSSNMNILATEEVDAKVSKGATSGNAYEAAQETIGTEISEKTNADISEKVETDAQKGTENSLIYEDDDVIVTVSGDDGVIPEGAELSVKAITEGEELDKVSDKLEEYATEKGIEIPGFLAYDISLVNKDGDEIEPNGKVSVSMDYKEATIPESVSETSEVDVDVLHFEENDDKVEVKNLTDDAVVTVNDDSEVESVRFETESFSTYTLTWVANWYTTYELKLNYVESEKNNGQFVYLDGLSGGINLTKDVTYNFSDYAKEIAGYKYLGTRLEDINGEEFVSVKPYVDEHYYYNSYYYRLIRADGTYKDVEYGPQMYMLYEKQATVNKENQIETLDTSDVISINLFDYKANKASSSNDAVDTTSYYSEGYGINKNHYLKFNSNSNQPSTDQNKYVTNYGVHSGIVNNKLGSDGYPTLASWGNNESLSYLFNLTDIDNAKKCYPNMNYLFVKDENGYYSYDSETNFATIADSEDGNFAVYKDAKCGFFPFTSYSLANDKGTNAKGDTLGSNTINHYFGMTVDTTFLQPASGKIDGKPMKFEFSGDDDVWLYIDDVLILDIGGIHAKVSGSIDFSTGEVYVSNVAYKEYRTTIKDLCEAAGIEIDEGFNGNTFADYTTHTMKFFYMERGNYDSNCKLKFNLQTLPKGQLFVSKTAAGVEADDNTDYQFVLKNNENKPVANASYTVNGGETVYKTDAKGSFSLKKNEYALFADLYAGDYKVVETGVTNSSYSIEDFTTKISVNGSKATESIDRVAQVTLVDNQSSRVEFRNLKDIITNTGSSYRKYINYNSEVDDYDLTLEFKAPKEKIVTTDEEENQTVQTSKVDLLFVFDMSGSMSTEYGDRLSKAKNALYSMVDVLEAKKNVDTNYKLVTFSDSATIKTDSWVNGKTIKSTVSKLSNPTGGTNYQAAFVKAQSAVSSGARSDAQQIVVFLTDGEPTFHLEKNNGKLSNSGSSKKGGGYYTNDKDYNGALMGAEALTGADVFYAVGIELENNVYGNKSGLDVLNDVAAKVPNAAPKEAYNSEATDLSTLFANIAGQIITNVTTITTETYKYASNVTITDSLSEYVDAEIGSDFTISVLDAEGNEAGTAKVGKLGSSDATYTLKADDKDVELAGKYDATNKVVTLDFPDDYELVGDYTYSITFKVKASALANKTYSESGYNAKGDANTDAPGNDTSSGKDGFKSNTKAEVTYTYKDKSVKDVYDHPVVQVHTIYDWTLTKVSASDNKVKLEDAIFALTNKADKTQKYQGTSDANGLVSWTDKDGNEVKIPAGTYILTEEQAPVGYEKSNIKLTITIDEFNKITVKSGRENYSKVTENADVDTVSGVTTVSYDIIFDDVALYRLPSAGGNGIFGYIISGLLMMIGGALLVYRRRKSITC